MEKERKSQILAAANARMSVPFSDFLHEIRVEGTSVFMGFLEEWAYMGESFQEALFTANRGDWLLPSRDGPLAPLLLREFFLRVDLGDLDEAVKWTEKYYANLAAVQRVVRPAENPLLADGPKTTEQQGGGSDMDSGEAAPVGGCQTLVNAKDAAPPTPTKTLNLYRLRKRSSWWRSLFQREMTGVYVRDEVSRRWDRFRVKLRRDGYTFTLGTPVKGKFQSELCGEMTYETETDTLLNFRLLDEKGTPIVRLVGDGAGGISFYEFNLDW
jgi:hypothetical protein